MLLHDINEQVKVRALDCLNDAHTVVQKYDKNTLTTMALKLAQDQSDHRNRIASIMILTKYSQDMS